MANNNNAAVSPPQHHSKKPYLVNILAISPPSGQSQNYKRLTQAVDKQELTESLELLAQSEIEDDLLTLFIITNIQSLGGAV